MPVGAAIAVGSVASAGIGAYASGKASDKQANAAANALSAQQAMFAQTQANFKPYLDVGKGATYTLGSLYGIGQDGTSVPTNADYSQFYNSPDYAFAQQQGELGLTRAENARGMNLSGGALKDISQFNQGLATQQFGNYYNRLLSLSQLGGSAAASAAGSGANFSNQMSNSIQGQGQAQAAGIVGGSNAITGGINSGITNSLLYNAINRSSYAAPTGGVLPGGSSLGFGGIGSA